MKKLVGSWSDAWLDMSPYVVHFTKAAKPRTAYDNSMSILSRRRIEARTRFGTGKQHPIAPQSICFSEIPLQSLARLADKRGSYGIRFRKEFVVSRNGGPIMYAYKDTPHAKALRGLVSQARHNEDEPIWKIAPFVDQPGQYGPTKYFYEWEREWRHVGNLDFNKKDAAFLIIPEELHSQARFFFNEAERENLGPNYKCPFIDPYWNVQQIKAAFNEAQS
ncbi:hypothetical protein GOB15_07095 [Sinorhizobium meliloti]|nr:hypothetical protein [Sinorhizobium meliloti]MDW9509460.1 hypothetical protein [Sinorhizobium meliloti]MDX0772236.1 hypothetical protein [Sinorhizobium medicae]MDX0906708.1 hypothetical protein [Sinorhizobium medicae]MDX1164210.1 hypothetical protein [Sinorhizobium medicae]